MKNTLLEVKSKDIPISPTDDKLVKKSNFKILNSFFLTSYITAGDTLMIR